MKKLIVSVLFFGSCGIAFAQMGAGGWNPNPTPTGSMSPLQMEKYYAQMMDRYQYPQCTTQTMIMPRKVRDNCESVWNHSAAGSSQPKEGEEYVPPFSATHDSDFTALAYTRFLNTHKNDDLIRPNCNKFKTSPGMCNAQMIQVKKGGFLGLFGVGLAGQAVQGCRYYPTMVNEKKTVRTCPRPKPREEKCDLSGAVLAGKTCEANDPYGCPASYKCGQRPSGIPPRDTDPLVCVHDHIDGCPWLMPA